MTPHQQGFQANNKNGDNDFKVRNLNIVLKPDEKKLEIVWRNVIIFTILHIGAAYGLYLLIFRAMWTTIIASYVLAYVSGLGITAGAHRLWAHKSYKAKLPLQILLLILNTISMQNDVIEWVRDHRMHHKYTDTDADPHNSRRGFFFAHMGWLLVRKHPEVIIKGKDMNFSDLTENPLLRFQRRYYKILAPLASLIIPTYICTLWGETAWNAFFVFAIYRYVRSLHTTWLVNSAAHLWGNNKPYDKSINPVETKLVSLLVLGEGFHNYHHVFPWDYKTAELGSYLCNLTTMFIDIMAKIGWAYDLKTATPDFVRKRAQRTGDGSHGMQDSRN